VANLIGLSNEELYAMDALINAVKVVTHRENTPATSLLAGIFGFTSFIRQAEAIAYLDFAGFPFEVDLPIVLCSYSIQGLNDKDELAPTCTTGRMINSGNANNNEQFNTGAWSDLQDGAGCNGTSNSSISNLLADKGCQGKVTITTPTLATLKGQATILSKIMECWQTWRNDNGEIPWPVKLPVVDCEDNKNVGLCPKVVGVVTVEIVWIQEKEDPHFNDVPKRMADWDGSAISDGEKRWDNFTSHFNLNGYGPNGEEIDAPYVKKALYFKPSCEFGIGEGSAGGTNFGALSRRPVLVE
jgi:hypothetical protein